MELRSLIGGLIASAALAGAASADENLASNPAGEIAHPVWASTPSRTEISRFYPYSAMAAGKVGMALVSCTAGSEGSLKLCHVVCAEPKNWGFDQAALGISSHYVLKTPLPDGESPEGRTVTLPFRFAPPGWPKLKRCDGKDD